MDILQHKLEFFHLFQKNISFENGFLSMPSKRLFRKMLTNAEHSATNHSTGRFDGTKYKSFYRQNTNSIHKTVTFSP